MMALNQLEKRMTGKSTFFWVTTLFPLLLIFPRSRTGTRSLEIWTGKAFWSRCTHRWKSRAKLLPPFLAVFERLIRATFSTWKSTTPPGVLKSLGIHLEHLPTLPSRLILREVTSAIRTTEAEVASILRHFVAYRNA
jgi:hypothetical protein